MKTKKIITIILVISLLASMMLVMTGCSKTLNGTYVSKGLIASSFTFTSDGDVVMSAFGLNVNGKYRIEDDKLIITYSVLGIDTDWERSFRKEGKSIFIDGEEFVKQ